MRKFTKTLLTFVSILTMLLVGCSTKDEVLAQESTEKIQMPWFAAGTYVGKADGYTGHIEVSVTVDEINILSIEIEEINDSNVPTVKLNLVKSIVTPCVT